MLIRQAGNSDIEKISELVANYLNTSTFTSFSPNNQSIRQTLSEIINDVDSVLLVAIDDDKLVGTIMGQVMSSMTGRSKLECREMFWWVEPEYRSLALGSALIGELEKKVKQAGANYMSIGCVHAVEADLLETVYG